MLSTILLYIGSVAVILWGMAHIAPTKPVVKGFGKISQENKRIITMEWVAEGLTLCFIGVLVLLVTILGESSNPVSIIVYRVSALMLIIMAAWTLLTGARTAIVPIKICPIVKTTIAILFFLGSVL
jgi:hypothetical protein